LSHFFPYFQLTLFFQYISQLTTETSPFLHALLFLRAAPPINHIAAEKDICEFHSMGIVWERTTERTKTIPPLKLSLGTHDILLLYLSRGNERRDRKNTTLFM